MNPNKRRREAVDDPKASDSDISFDDDDGSTDGEALSSDGEIQDLKPQKSQQTKKRKLRASRPSAFGATLQTLLHTETPSELPLSLKPSIGRQRNEEKLEQRAKKILQEEKKEAEDKRRIKDVIGGWGGESERSLRKVAQRGVVQLFNAVQQSQANDSAELEQRKGMRGSGKATLPAPSEGSSPRKGKDNLLGRGKEVTDKNGFFDIIKGGGIVATK